MTGIFSNELSPCKPRVKNKKFYTFKMKKQYNNLAEDPMHCHDYGIRIPKFTNWLFGTVILGVERRDHTQYENTE
jgi:hypothetical protein